MVGAASPGGGDGAWLDAWPDVPPVRRCVLPALACRLRYARPNSNNLRRRGGGHAIKEAVAVRRVSRIGERRARACFAEDRSRWSQPEACQEAGDACRCACGWGGAGSRNRQRLTPCPAGLYGGRGRR
jgi:hypothetical protein